MSFWCHFSLLNTMALCYNKVMKEEVVLYRKYRPQNFKEVLGQEHIVKALEGSIQKGNFSHAYLFSGSRGTGKTSVARILAQEIGCSPNDIYEIDGASNRKIDDIREIREAVRSYPFDSPYKIYIIDEVHMLIPQAFNALLKTLEEPPPYVIFVLATTEPEKLPNTISSRCQSFYFKKSTHDTLKKVALDISKKEGVKIGTETADLIALLSEGSFRDTLVELAKVLSSANEGEVTHNDAVLILGVPKEETINSIIRATEENDLEKVMSALDLALDESTDTKVLLKLILRKMRAILLLKHAPGMKALFKKDFSEEDIDFIESLSKKN